MNTAQENEVGKTFVKSLDNVNMQPLEKSLRQELVGCQRVFSLSLIFEIISRMKSQRRFVIDNRMKSIESCTIRNYRNMQ